MTLVVKTLAEQIFTLVRERIVTGKLPQDSAIRQDALAAELGVSKIPLREAFVRLEQEGLLISHANRGFFVRPLTVDEAEEVFALRLKIEPEAVGAAAAVASDAERAAAKVAFEDTDRSIGQHAHDVGKFNRAFHLALVRPLQRAITTQFLERLHIMSERYVGKHLEPAGRDHRANIEHAQLLEAWLAGDSAEAEALARHHIAETLADLRKQFAA
jgi:DNA-binding GntR family transcriptional regulator